MSEFDKYVEIKDRFSSLIDVFFEEETTTEERKQIIEEMRRFPSYLTGALFGIGKWNYEFEKDGRRYILQYNPTYILDLFKSEYELNLYSGLAPNARPIRQEVDKSKAQIFLKFLTLIDAIREGTFELDDF